MDVSQLLPLILLVGVFYFLLIRPQQRRVRKHQNLVSTIQQGDEVITVGGAYGRVGRMDDTSVWLEIAPGTTVRFSKQAISRKVEESPTVQE